MRAEDFTDTIKKAIKDKFLNNPINNEESHTQQIDAVLHP